MTYPGHLLKENQIYAGKEMGQNFLSNPETARMIVEQTGIDSHARVLEIGPGLGALTIPIAQKTRHVTVVEKDRRLIPLLAQALESHGIDWVRVLNQDFLKTDIASLADGQKLVVMGNLPYNISSQILFRLIRSRNLIDKKSGAGSISGRGLFFPNLPWIPPCCRLIFFPPGLFQRTRNCCCSP